MDKWRKTNEVADITKKSLESAVTSLTQSEYLPLLTGEAYIMKNTLKDFIAKLDKIQDEVMLFAVDTPYILEEEPINCNTEKKPLYVISGDFTERFPATFRYVSSNLQIAEILIKEGLLEKKNISDLTGEGSLFITFGTVKEYLHFKRRFNEYLKDTRKKRIFTKPTPAQVITYWEGFVEYYTLPARQGNNSTTLENQKVLVMLNSKSNTWSISINDDRLKTDIGKNYGKKLFISTKTAKDFLKKHKDTVTRGMSGD